MENKMSKDHRCVVAVGAANFAHVFPAQVLAAIEKRADVGHVISRCATSGVAEFEADKLRKLVEKVKPLAFIGISINPDKQILDLFKNDGVHVVLIDEEVSGYTTITTDNFAGGFIAGDYLAKSGRKNIGIVSGRTNVEGGYNAKQRFAGFVEGLRQNGIIFDDNHLIEVISYSYNEGFDALQKFYADKRNLDAVFCAAGDMCALGIVKAARELRVKIPEDMALVGYDDIEASRTSKPPLTTIRQPIEQMAVKAYETAVFEMEEILLNPKKIVFKPELVKRESA
jgi:DNA-binding LacI/PurR family transcriptional regulator